MMGGPGGPGGPGGMSSPLDPSTKRTAFQQGQVKGYLYEPKAPGEKSHIGVFVMHSDADYSSFSACTELSKRGYTVLCAANSGQGLDRIVLDAKTAVAYLKRQPGIQKVILFGHSGGATLMTAYQMIAENGVKSCQGPEKLIPCSDNLAGVPAADGMVLADSNWGNAVMSLFSLDPAVLADDDGVHVNQDLNLFNTKNGFNARGNSDYSQEFIDKFQKATGERMNRLIKTAEERLALIDAGKGRFTDDEPFVVAGAESTGFNNKLFSQDIKLMAHTRNAWSLLHPDGTVTNQIVHSVRVPQAGRPSTSALNGGAVNTTVRAFLKNRAIRVTSDFHFDESSVYGVDWNSSYSSPPGNIQGIHVPTLIMGMTGHWEYLAAETIYEKSAASDKSIAFVEGAGHMYEECRQCETTPGQYANVAKTLYDYVDGWLSKNGRFLEAAK
jgi:pimeloyl-ACP methyl ester carboxylesterase